ncbi:MAG: GNAT family N-acetyltransferase [Caulobacteraceae bacterium]|nr:GNAT family N-acetyltransferase [Caulobacteraceae bacterium]
MQPKKQPLQGLGDADRGQVVGYVTLSAGQIERAALPKPRQRNRPDPVPATLLGQLAIHKDYQARGYARSLLLFALRAALRASRDVGAFGVFTHPLDHAARGFHARWGFEDLPFDPRRAMIVRMVDLKRGGLDR